jgi:hypothetical protein
MTSFASKREQKKEEKKDECSHRSRKSKSFLHVGPREDM